MMIIHPNNFRLEFRSHLFQLKIGKISSSTSCEKKSAKTEGKKEQETKHMLGYGLA